MNFVCIGRPFLSAGHRRMGFCGLKVGSFLYNKGYLRRRYLILVEANIFLQIHPKQFFCEANHTSENTKSSICKVKEEGNGGSESNLSIPRTSYVKKGMEIGRHTSNVEELTNIKGDVIDLPELQSTKNKENRVRYIDDQKIVVSGDYGVRNEPVYAWRVNGRLGLVRGYLTSFGAGSGKKLILKLFMLDLYSALKSLFQRFSYGEALHKRKHEDYYFSNKTEVPKGNNQKSEFKDTSYAGQRIGVKTKDEDETKDEEELTDINIKEGDIINLHDLLFTKNRDYLVKYSDQKVKPEQLVGKAILLYFVPVCCDLIFEMEIIKHTTFLIDIYNDLLPNNNFEVIVVAVDDLCTKSLSDLRRTLEKKFETMFATMPWAAIPFSDIASRKRIARRFSISGGEFSLTSSVILDSKGMVLKRNACYLFGEYGTPGYPFTDERIKFLDSEDDGVAKQPSLELLLGSPERDYVISNENDRVPIHTLKDKVVALFFYEDSSTNYELPELTLQLKMAYKELAKENFEVVLLYLYDTRDTTCCTDEESFWKIFKTMPWLALPFKDSNHKKLKRIFGYPDDLDGPERAPTLVMIGPNVEFVDSCGADILMKFGPPSYTYPFTRRKLAKLETEMIKELKLEMLWDPNTVFRAKIDGSKLLKLRSPNFQIPFSQFAGKRLLIYFDMNEFYQCTHWEELLILKDLYHKMKGTDDEFEVIFIKDSSSTKKPDGPWLTPDYGELPWLVHYYDKGYSLPKELEHSVFHFNYDRGGKGCPYCLLVAFDRDGSIVRKTFDPTFNDKEFPFYAGGLEEEYLDQLNYFFGWYYWDYMEQKHHIIYQRG